MEFIVNHKHFTQALSEVSKAISTKAFIPILSGIKNNCKSIWNYFNRK